MSRYRLLVPVSSVFALLACSGSGSSGLDGTSNAGTSKSTAGATTRAQGGTSSQGGSTNSRTIGSSVGAGSSGGSVFVAGGGQVGSTNGAGGNGGGTLATGGTSTRVTTVASGGNSIGGASSTGGAASVGGASPTGGTSTTGGAISVGGTAGKTGGVGAGGNGATGGVVNTGGTPNLAGNTSGGTLAGAGAQATAGSSGSSIAAIETLDVANVWSGHPVSFALVTRNDRQFAAYYDGQRRMTVASRQLGSNVWTYKVLPSTLGWDSHNYVAMTLDSTDQIHVSGNMHGVPLVYFRTTAAMDISTLATLNSMVGTNETQVTYPIFFNGPSGDLVFEYRDGASGNGNTIFNTYSTTSRNWTRTLNTALLNGTSASMNAYPEGPVLGPDGYWHLVWVWRNTADASTNHDLSYAKTQDLVHWFKANGTALTLPITPTTGDIVDPVPVSGGMINNNTRVGFDAQNRPIIAYHKFDANGYTQLYEARLENNAWVIYRATDWTYRWAFGGTGTLVFQVSIDEGPKLLPDGRLIQNYYHAQYGGQGTLVLNPTTLHAEQTLSPPLRPYPLALDVPESTYKDPVSQQAMVVRWAQDAGAGSDPSVTYMLRWETLPSNADAARANIPPATKLRLYGFR